MADLLMLATLVTFMLGCVVYVWWCDRIIGPDRTSTDPTSTDVDDGVVRAATSEATA